MFLFSYGKKGQGHISNIEIHSLLVSITKKELIIQCWIILVYWKSRYINYYYYSRIWIHRNDETLLNSLVRWIISFSLFSIDFFFYFFFCFVWRWIENQPLYINSYNQKHISFSLRKTLSFRDEFQRDLFWIH